jgi:hypothetical protein
LQTTRQDLFIYYKVSKLIINIVTRKLITMPIHSHSKLSLVHLDWNRIAPIASNGSRDNLFIYDFII